MNLTNEHIRAIVKTQVTIWILAIFFATGYALFAKLIWTAKFPILIFLPLLMIGFALASTNGLKSTLEKFTNAES
jgi:hypothetical protein